MKRRLIHFFLAALLAPAAGVGLQGSVFADQYVPGGWASAVDQKVDAGFHACVKNSTKMCRGEMTMHISGGYVFPHVIHNGVELPLVHGTAAEAFPGDAPVIGYRCASVGYNEYDTWWPYMLEWTISANKMCWAYNGTWQGAWGLAPLQALCKTPNAQSGYFNSCTDWGKGSYWDNYMFGGSSTFWYDQKIYFNYPNVLSMPFAPVTEEGMARGWCEPWGQVHLWAGRYS